MNTSPPLPTLFPPELVDKCFYKLTPYRWYNDISSFDRVYIAPDVKIIYGRTLQIKNFIGIPDHPDGYYKIEIVDSKILVDFEGIPKKIMLLNLLRTDISSFEGLTKEHTITKLDCKNSLIQSFKHLEAKIEILDCSDNFHLTSLQYIPQTLRCLDLSSTSISSLIGLPPTLKLLCCLDTLVETLEGVPKGLEVLEIGPNLTSLDGLPLSIRHLRCTSRRVSSFENFHSSIEILDIEACHIKTLPKLEKSSLSQIKCSWRFDLTSIPKSAKVQTSVFTRETLLKPGIELVAHLECHCDNPKILGEIFHYTNLESVRFYNAYPYSLSIFEKCKKIQTVRCRIECPIVGCQVCMNHVTSNQPLDITRIPYTLKHLSFYDERDLIRFNQPELRKLQLSRKLREWREAQYILLREICKDAMRKLFSRKSRVFRSSF